jgi:hypothetical protein
LAKDNTPITWPTVALYQPAQVRFVITTSIGLPQKAYNLRRAPRVAMLYSDPTGSGLAAPPVVLVQGDAVCPDKIVTRSDVNRPGVGGGSDPWRGWSHASPTKVSR